MKKVIMLLTILCLSTVVYAGTSSQGSNAMQVSPKAHHWKHHHGHHHMAKNRHTCHCPTPCPCMDRKS